uniref:(northern house mosquito) hypothetical protein n=2 Tax=Culex pipiens TaxID=7175 RepID=A0A8D8EV36_CULPI
MAPLAFSPRHRKSCWLSRSSRYRWKRVEIHRPEERPTVLLPREVRPELEASLLSEELLQLKFRSCLEQPPEAQPSSAVVPVLSPSPRRVQTEPLRRLLRHYPNQKLTFFLRISARILG